MKNGPRIQAIPIRTPLGARLRQALVAKRPDVPLHVDYSSLENRILERQTPVKPELPKTLTVKDIVQEGDVFRVHFNETSQSMILGKPPGVSLLDDLLAGKHLSDRQKLSSRISRLAQELEVSLAHFSRTKSSATFSIRPMTSQVYYTLSVEADDSLPPVDVDDELFDKAMSEINRIKAEDRDRRDALFAIENRQGWIDDEDDKVGVLEEFTYQTPRHNTVLVTRIMLPTGNNPPYLAGSCSERPDNEEGKARAIARSRFLLNAGELIQALTRLDPDKRVFVRNRAGIYARDKLAPNRVFGCQRSTHDREKLGEIMDAKEALTVKVIEGAIAEVVRRREEAK